MTSKFNKQKQLEDNKTFCIFPWTHMQIRPDGAVMNCCLADYSTGILGDANKQTLREVWNGEKMRETRRKMLNGERLSQCSMCYAKEENNDGSFRIHYNREFADKFDDIVPTTQDDGTVEKLNIVYIDWRLSNICNFKCRSCGHYASSSWYHDEKEIHRRMHGGDLPLGPQVERVMDKNANFMEQLEEIEPTLEEIYFAGGEPLIMPEHWQILDFLESRGRFDVKIWYNTNFSQMSYKKRNVMDIWNKFENVRVQASIDGMRERGEYIRKGMNWEQVEHNRLQMFERCPHVEFDVSATVGALNYEHALDFYDEWYRQKGWIDARGFNWNFMFGPEHLTAFILPQWYKEQVYEKYCKYIDKHLDVPGLRGFANALRDRAYIPLTRDYTDKIPFFKRWTRVVDEIRNEDFQSTFPELRFLYE
jgi:MoaA/NifB/PqqE/SkfB family radical SAM enzyme